MRAYNRDPWDDLFQFIGICFNEDMDEMYPAPDYRGSAKKAVDEFLRSQPAAQVKHVLRELEPPGRRSN
jgi:hypothetical protein